jgi:hypothetical protein
MERLLLKSYSKESTRGLISKYWVREIISWHLNEWGGGEGDVGPVFVHIEPYLLYRWYQ